MRSAVKVIICTNGRSWYGNASSSASTSSGISARPFRSSSSMSASGYSKLAIIWLSYCAYRRNDCHLIMRRKAFSTVTCMVERLSRLETKSKIMSCTSLRCMSCQGVEPRRGMRMLLTLLLSPRTVPPARILQRSFSQAVATSLKSVLDFCRFPVSS